MSEWKLIFSHCFKLHFDLSLSFLIKFFPASLWSQEEDAVGTVSLVGAETTPSSNKDCPKPGDPHEWLQDNNDLTFTTDRLIPTDLCPTFFLRKPGMGSLGGSVG